VLNERVIAAVRDGGAFTSVRGFLGVHQRDIRFTATMVRNYAQEWGKARIRLRSRSTPAKSRFAWRGSIRRKEPPTPIVGLEAGGTRGTAGHRILIGQDKPEEPERGFVAA